MFFNLKFMATVRFLVQSKSDNAPIYLRLTLGREGDYKRKTTQFINPKSWSKKTGLPKQNNADNKNLTITLKNLATQVLKELNLANQQGEDVDGDWLQKTINKHFNKEEVTELDYLSSYGDYFLKNLKYRHNGKTNTIGVSKSTERKYKTIVNKIKAFDINKGKRTKLVEVDLKYRNEFIEYLKDNNERILNDNSIGRYLKFVKTICLDAERNGYKVNGQLKDFKGFTVDAPKVILTVKELEQIKKTTLISENHQLARDWLIIGCYTGQRVSDLLRMKKNLIKSLQGFEFIVITQQKTKKTVQIPIHSEVREILKKRNGNFPPLFTKNIESNKALFNRYLKQLCKVAGIETLVEGNKYDEKSKRYLLGIFPKHELISSHICRRSFATNHYATEEYPTPLLMNVTGHKTEKMFLTYIGKQPIDYSLQLAKIWSKIEEVKNSRLNVVKPINHELIQREQNV